MRRPKEKPELEPFHRALCFMSECDFDSMMDFIEALIKFKENHLKRHPTIDRRFEKLLFDYSVATRYFNDSRRAA